MTSAAATHERTLSAKCLGVTSLMLIVLETLRGTNGIVHGAEVGGLSFVGITP